MGYTNTSISGSFTFNNSNYSDYRTVRNPSPSTQLYYSDLSGLGRSYYEASDAGQSSNYPKRNGRLPPQSSQQAPCANTSSLYSKISEYMGNSSGQFFKSGEKKPELGDAASGGQPVQTSFLFNALNQIGEKIAPPSYETTLRRRGVFESRRSWDTSSNWLAPMTGETLAGTVASRFQSSWQSKVLSWPGSVFVTREQMGFRPEDLAMVDIGGEGQKTAVGFSDPSLGSVKSYKTGNVHAINVNAQTEISSVPLNVTLEPGQPSVEIHGGYIPNLVRPATSWGTQGDSALKYPFADGFSNLTLMEGAPLLSESVSELHRITDTDGWMVFTVAPNFQDNIDKLAELHSNGRQWVYTPESEYEFPTHVLPPQYLTAEQEKEYEGRFDGITSHELHDVVKDIQSQRHKYRR